MRMGPDDEGFWDTRYNEQAEALRSFLSWVASFNDPTLSVVVLYLPGAEETVSEGVLGHLENLCSFGLRLVRAGPKDQRGFPQALAGERSLWLRMDTSEALSRLNERVVLSEMAYFVTMDGRGHGAEILAPADAPVYRLLRTVASEMNWETHNGPEGEPVCVLVETIVASAPGAERMLPIPFDQPVPKNFVVMGRGAVPVAKLRVMGLYYPWQNARLDSRISAVLSLLKDLMTAFASEEYQAGLNGCGDQIDVRDLVKEVHLTLLPQHGFPLTREMEFKHAFQVQTRMQVFINSALHAVTPGGGEERLEELNKMASESIAVSGIARLASLPARRKGRTKEQKIAPLILKAFSMETAVTYLPPGSQPFRNNDPNLPVAYGGWLGNRRAPTAFLEAPSEELAYYLRDDPDGPFAMAFSQKPQDRAQAEYEVTAEDMEHWLRWGFEVDEHERIMKADWHTLPGVGDQAKLFIPRLGKPGALKQAPPRCVAFAEAFRMANLRCWSALVQALQDLQVRRELEHDITWTARGSRLVGSLIRCVSERGHFGVMEAQVWWGNRLLTLPSHKDGATSLLHLGVTLSGKRTVRVGAFNTCDTREAAKAQGLVKLPTEEPADGMENVWDDKLWTRLQAKNGTRKDYQQRLGSIYLSAPYCFEHGVRFEASTKQAPIMSLQCRFAFEPHLGQEMNRLRDNVMWDISHTISEVLRRMSEMGHLRMPSLEEVQNAEEELSLSEQK